MKVGAFLVIIALAQWSDALGIDTVPSLNVTKYLGRWYQVLLFHANTPRQLFIRKFFVKKSASFPHFAKNHESSDCFSICMFSNIIFNVSLAILVCKVLRNRLRPLLNVTRNFYADFMFMFALHNRIGSLCEMTTQPLRLQFNVLEI